MHPGFWHFEHFEYRQLARRSCHLLLFARRCCPPLSLLPAAVRCCPPPSAAAVRYPLPAVRRPLVSLSLLVPLPAVCCLLGCFCCLLLVYLTVADASMVAGTCLARIFLVTHDDHGDMMIMMVIIMIVFFC